MSSGEDREGSPIGVEERDLLVREAADARPTSASPSVRDESAGALHAPDIIGLEILEAHAVARQAGLRLVVRVWETKLGPWGMILSQVPEPGARVRPRTRVEAVVAGRPHLAVPDVRGLRLDAASEQLRRAGLEPFVTTERGSRAATPGTVVATRPLAGALVTHGSRVALTVSRARLTRGEAERA